MTQAELNRAVALATGETVTTIRELGFSLADPDEVAHDPQPCDLDVQAIDWDAYDAKRHVPAFTPSSHRQLVSA